MPAAKAAVDSVPFAVWRTENPLPGARADCTSCAGTGRVEAIRHGQASWKRCVCLPVHALGYRS
jgi:hypothetical protein